MWSSPKMTCLCSILVLKISCAHDLIWRLMLVSSPSFVWQPLHVWLCGYVSNFFMYLKHRPLSFVLTYPQLSGLECRLTLLPTFFLTSIDQSSEPLWPNPAGIIYQPISLLLNTLCGFCHILRANANTPVKFQSISEMFSIPRHSQDMIFDIFAYHSYFIKLRAIKKRDFPRSRGLSWYFPSHTYPSASRTVWCHVVYLLLSAVTMSHPVNLVL